MKKIYTLLLSALALPVAAQSVSFTTQPYGTNIYNACTVDMNGDYLDDIVVIQSNNLRVYRQLTAGGFQIFDYAVPGLGTGFVTPDWSIAAGDFDKNGFNDLVLGNGSRVTVVKANADGTGYSFVTYPQNIFTQRTNFVDINNDGHLDLFACHDVAQSHAYRNDGAGNLTFDISLFPTLAVGGNYASIWTDYNNDGLVDMYLTKCRGGAPTGDPQRINLLYKNNGNGTFTEVGAAAGVNDGAQSWSTGVADFDNDGDMDFLVSNISDQNRLYRNNGDGTFTNVYSTTEIASQVGSWEIQTADFNNDGWVDFLWENSKELYLNNGDMTFTGYDIQVKKGGIADLNNDGFLDIQNGVNIFLNNGNDNNWLKINLQGVASNRNGIGARLELYGSWGKQIREVRSGESFSVMNSLNGHFGIGEATEIDKLVIRWPSGTVDVIQDPEPNTTVFVLEGSSPELSVSDVVARTIVLAPNPVSDALFITAPADVTLSAITVFDTTSRLVINANANGNTINTTALAPGAYIVNVRSTDGELFSSRFIKN